MKIPNAKTLFHFAFFSLNPSAALHQNCAVEQLYHHPHHQMFFPGTWQINEEELKLVEMSQPHFQQQVGKGGQKRRKMKIKMEN